MDLVIVSTVEFLIETAFSRAHGFSYVRNTKWPMCSFIVSCAREALELRLQARMVADHVQLKWSQHLAPGANNVMYTVMCI